MHLENDFLGIQFGLRKGPDAQKVAARADSDTDTDTDSLLLG